MRARLLAMLAMPALACSAEPIDCEALAAELITCDVQPAVLACDRLAPDEQVELRDRVQDEGCEALWRDDEVDPLACEAFGWECPRPLHTSPGELPTRYPVVFVGGIDAREAFDWNPRIVDLVAKQTGSETYHVALPSWAPTPERSAALWKALRDLDTSDDRFNLVCYAVGGIDCRYLVSPGGLYAEDPDRQAEVARAVVSITTIATPHLGTDVANAALSFSTFQSASAIVTALLGSEAEAARDIPETSLRDTLRALSNEYAVQFNANVVDAPEVMYQSWAGISHVGGQPFVPSQSAIEAHCVNRTGALDYERHPGTQDVMTELLWATAPFSERTLTNTGQVRLSPSDGMVSVESAKWGRFRGCLPADHYDVIGRLGDEGPDPVTGFDAAGFYAEIAVELAEEGF